MSSHGTVVNDAELQVQISQIVGWAIKRLTGDKTLPETFSANISEYLYSNFDEFIAQYGRMNLETVKNWLSEFPIETIQ